MAGARREAAVPLAIASSFDYGLALHEQLPLVAAAGFTHLSMGVQHSGGEYLSTSARARLKRMLADQGLAMDTIHGPRADQPQNVATLTEVIEAAGDLGAKVVVAHAGPFNMGAEQVPARLEALLCNCEQLEPVAARASVKVALENVLPGPATDLVRLALAQLPPDRFGFCYDSSHDQVGGPRPFDLLTELGDRLIAVHLSDRVRDFVDHLVPGEGFIDWPGLCRCLGGRPFSGPLLLEVTTAHSAYKRPEQLLEAALQAGHRLYRLWRGHAPDS